MQSESVNISLLRHYSNPHRPEGIIPKIERSFLHERHKILKCVGLILKITKTTTHVPEAKDRHSTDMSLVPAPPLHTSTPLGVSVCSDMAQPR